MMGVGGKTRLVGDSIGNSVGDSVGDSTGDGVVDDRRVVDNGVVGGTRLVGHCPAQRYDNRWSSNSDKQIWFVKVHF